ncbi:MAG: DUF4384 domain-containing protein [Treponema sp.]|nr:DUF4384 domain-containing protein [Treponema sp.]
MKHLYLSIFCLLLLSPSFLFAQNSNVKKAQGHGNSEAAAKSDALANLSFYFYTNVKSQIQSSTLMSQENDKFSKSSSIDKKSLISSELPLYGVTFEISDNGLSGREKEYQATASMDPKIVLPLYKLELEKTCKNIDSQLLSLDKLKGTKKENAYTALAGEYANYQKLEMILEFLGGKDIPRPSRSPEDFNTEYKKFTRDVTSLEKAAQITVDYINENAGKNISGIYVYAPQYEGDGAATQFSRTLASFIQGKLSSKTALDKGNSLYYLQGTYYMVPGSVDADDMILNFYLCKNDGSILLSTPLIRLGYDIYGQYKYLPAGYSLTQEIAKGNVADPNFGVSIRINGDRKPQTFKSGDSLIIEARVTSPCYIYVLGHVFNENNEEFSYLFPLEPYADDKEIFVRKISSKEVNQWVVLNPVIEDEVASIEIIPPYGEETLQIFAVTEDDIDEVTSLVPDYWESDDYYIVRGSPSSVSNKTRGLAIKKVSEKAAKVVHKAEAEITYTTYYK